LERVDLDPDAVRGGGEVLYRQHDELGSSESDGEAEQQQGAVAQSCGGGCVDAVDELAQWVSQEGGLLVRGAAVDAGDPFEDHEDPGV
jgi:hypothetical protein